MTPCICEHAKEATLWCTPLIQSTNKLIIDNTCIQSSLKWLWPTGANIQQTSWRSAWDSLHLLWYMQCSSIGDFVLILLVIWDSVYPQNNYVWFQMRRKAKQIFSNLNRPGISNLFTRVRNTKEEMVWSNYCYTARFTIDNNNVISSFQLSKRQLFPCTKSIIVTYYTQRMLCGPKYNYTYQVTIL